MRPKPPPPKLTHKCKSPKCDKMLPDDKLYCNLPCYHYHLRTDPSVAARHGEHRIKVMGNVRTLEMCKCPDCEKEYKKRMFVQESERGKKHYKFCKDCGGEGEYADVWGHA